MIEFPPFPLIPLKMSKSIHLERDACCARYRTRENECTIRDGRWALPILLGSCLEAASPQHGKMLELRDYARDRVPDANEAPRGLIPARLSDIRLPRPVTSRRLVWG